MASISVPSSALEAPPTPETTEPHPFPKAKLTAVSRIKNFVGGLSLKREPKIIFPPPSWFITNETSPTLNDDERTAESTGAPGNFEDGDEELDAPEPMTFAMKIRQLIASLPLPPSIATAVGAGHDSSAAEKSTSDAATQVDGNGPPVPDIVDARTMKLLSSEDVMNGDPRATGKKRQSVWSALERLRSGNAAAEKGEEKPPAAETEYGESVMMYSPLEPTADSEVELAESELEYAPAGEDAAKDSGKGKAPDIGAPPTAQPPAAEKHWVPSTTKISVFTTWWGYRLYLPPPVMATLNSNQMKATQRAALITTALQWFLKRIPLVIVPPQLRPMVSVLRRLSPILGYIGVFIAWSWSRISAYDKGNGVVLTATWLLPVALIPMSWDAGDIHGPPTRPPLPKDRDDGPPTTTSSASKAGNNAKKAKK